jgi:glutathione S-transferase
MSKYQLYYSPGACSMAVHVLLRELNQPVDLVRVDLRAPRDEAFLKISPRGQVPVLMEDGVPIYEGAAILIHLCEKFRSELLPAEGVLRGKALQALMFFNASVHPAYSKFSFVSKSATIDEKAKDAIKREACDKIQEIWDLVDAYLGENAYLAGDRITVGDILMTVIANWDWVSCPPRLGANVKRVIGEISQRPSFQEALAQEGVEYRAAA